MNSLINALKSVLAAMCHPPVLAGFIHEAEAEIATVMADVAELKAQVAELVGAKNAPAPEAEDAPGTDAVMIAKPDQTAA